MTEDSCFSAGLCYSKACTEASCLCVITSHLKDRTVGTVKDCDFGNLFQCKGNIISYYNSDYMQMVLIPNCKKPLCLQGRM